MVCFILSGLIQPFWRPLQDYYAGLLATAGLPVLTWAQPAPIINRLEHRGIGITAHGDLLPDRPLGRIETDGYTFYLPFIAAVLFAAAWRWRLFVPSEIIMVLAFFAVIHLAGLVMGFLIVQSSFATAEGYILLGPIELALLHSLFKVYVLFGMQLWNGLAVALLLVRVLVRGRPERSRLLSALDAPRGLACACILFCLPPVLYILAAPPLRTVAGPPQGTGITEWMMQRAGRAAEQDLQQAAAWYGSVIALDPDHAAALAGLGRIRQLSGEACAARDYFRQSLAGQLAPAIAKSVDRFLEQAESACAAQADRE